MRSFTALETHFRTVPAGNPPTAAGLTIADRRGSSVPLESGSTRLTGPLSLIPDLSHGTYLLRASRFQSPDGFRDMGFTSVPGEKNGLYTSTRQLERMSRVQEYGARRIDDDELVVTIDRSDESQRYRYVCPNGHVDWDRTNNHVWCRGCRRQIENGDADLDAEHYEILDKRENRLIPWDQVFVE